MSLAPGVLIEFTDPPPPLEPARIDVAAFVTICQRGPLHVPTRIGSWTELVARFGGFIPNGLGAYAAKAYFDQGGRVCWIVRVAADEHLTATIGPQPANRATSIVADAHAFVPGAAVTARQLGTLHTYLVVDVDLGTATVTWDRALHPDFDVTVPIDLAIGAGTAATTLLDAALNPVLRLEASSPGAWGNRLAVVVTPGRRAATTNRAEPASAAATPVVSTDGFASGARVTLTQTLAAVVVSSTEVVLRVDEARRVLWWAAPLPASLDPNSPLTLETESFDLTVLEAGAVREVFVDASLEPAHPRSVERVVAASLLVRVTVLGAGLPAPGRVVLRGGRDGTAGLGSAELLGDELGERWQGLATLGPVDEPAAVAIPDLVGEPTAARVEQIPTDETDPCWPCQPAGAPPDVLDPPIVEASARFSEADVARAQRAMVEHCTRNSERIALLDPPAADGALDDSQLRSWVATLSSSFAVAYAPWIHVVDPLRRAGGGLRRVPPSGHVAGVIAATDHAHGPWRSAANRALTWAHRLDQPISEATHATFNERGLNAIRALPGRGLVVLGGRTLSADTSLVFLNVRRTLIYLRRTLRHSLGWMVFEPNDLGLDALFATAVGNLLEAVWDAGGLVGSSPEDAFFVHTGTGDRAGGEFLGEIGVALARPAEFVVVRVSRIDNRLDLHEVVGTAAAVSR